MYVALPERTTAPTPVGLFDFGSYNLTDWLALAAAVVALATLAWTVLSYFWTRSRLSKFEKGSLEAGDREEFRIQRDTAISLITSSNGIKKQIGLTMLQDLRTSPLATDRDRTTIASVLNVVAGGGTP